MYHKFYKAAAIISKQYNVYKCIYIARIYVFGEPKQNLTWWGCHCWRHSTLGCGVRIRDASSATSSYTSRHTCWTGRARGMQGRAGQLNSNAHMHARMHYRLTGTAGGGRL